MAHQDQIGLDFQSHLVLVHLTCLERTACLCDGWW
jgi:hypothetical protein